MFKLAPYFAGGLAALVAMDFAPPVKSAIDQWTGSAEVGIVQVVNKVDRSRKGDRLVPLRPTAGTLGGSTVVKSPEIIVRDEGRAAAKSGPAEPASKSVVRGPKLPIGCDPAFSPLAASASLNFAGRCVS
jgi:hypothetical protein